MRILVTGAAGNLGGKLLEDLTQAGHDVLGADVIGDHVARLDICDFTATRDFPARAYRPQLVVHAAAWTDVDGCARDPQRALLVNGFGTQHVALAAAAVEAAIVYISSNEVFSGRDRVPLDEYAMPAPANPYGYSKRVGECVVSAHNPRHYHRAHGLAFRAWGPQLHPGNSRRCAGRQGAAGRQQRGRQPNLHQ